LGSGSNGSEDLITMESQSIGSSGAAEFLLLFLRLVPEWSFELQGSGFRFLDLRGEGGYLSGHSINRGCVSSTHCFEQNTLQSSDFGSVGGRSAVSGL
jgi:hypothetical protein